MEWKALTNKVRSWYTPRVYPRSEPFVGQIRWILQCYTNSFFRIKVFCKVELPRGCSGLRLPRGAPTALDPSTHHPLLGCRVLEGWTGIARCMFERSEFTAPGSAWSAQSSRRPTRWGGFSLVRYFCPYKRNELVHEGRKTRCNSRNRIKMKTHPKGQTPSRAPAQNHNPDALPPISIYN